MRRRIRTEKTDKISSIVCEDPVAFFPLATAPIPVWPDPPSESPGSLAHVFPWPVLKCGGLSPKPGSPGLASVNLLSGCLSKPMKTNH